jgi:hypothetical protein
MKIFTKEFASPQTLRAAQDHHDWIARTNPGTRIPAIIHTRPGEIDFEHIDGRHAGPEDLVDLANLLGQQHIEAHTSELHAARLDTPHTSGEVTIADFCGARIHRVSTLLGQGAAPGSLLTFAAAHRWLERATALPASFYKDANPRNFLITTMGPVVIDFDSLTLAPFGYDLAKLVVAITMTSGPLPGDTIHQALDTYNRHPQRKNLPGCTILDFAAWTEIHHILTAPYLGKHGYRFSWHTNRPVWLANQLHDRETDGNP